MNPREPHITINTDTIKKWAEERGGYPAMVENTADVDKSGILKIGFNSEEDTTVEKVSWDHFFDEFDENNLAFEYQDKNGVGEKSTHYKFVDRDEQKYLLEK